MACGIQLHVEHLLGNRAPVTILQNARVLDSVLHVKEDARRGTGIALIYKHRATPQEVAMAVESQIQRGIKERMAGADEGGKRLALRGDQRLLKGDALITRQYGLTRSDQTVAVAHGCRNMGDFIAARLALAGSAAELLEGFEEE